VFARKPAHNLQNEKAERVHDDDPRRKTSEVRRIIWGRRDGNGLSRALCLLKKERIGMVWWILLFGLVAMITWAIYVLFSALNEQCNLDDADTLLELMRAIREKDNRL